MIDWLTGLDNEITLALNAMHTPIADSIMLFLSAKTVWIPLYVLLAVLMFIPKWYGKKSSAFRYGSHIPLWLTGLIGILAVLLCFGLTEQITNIVKNIVERPRPGNTPILEGILHLPEGAGGGYGFFSAHASNTFCIAVFFSLLVRNAKFVVAMISWSLLNCWTRMYLGVHYPSDIFVGLLWGGLVGAFVYYIYIKSYFRMHSDFNYISSKYTSTGYNQMDIDIVLLVLVLTLLYAVIMALFF